jgi:hypothetical protein
MTLINSTNDDDTYNNSQLFIENIGVGLIDIPNLYKLDLKNNEYLVVGQRNNINPDNSLETEYNMIVNNNGVAINATRKELLETSAGLLINNDIICKGTIVACNLKFDNITFGNDVSSTKLTQLINSVNSNHLFFNGYSSNLINNIYTPNYLCLGNFASTYSNSHLLKISDSPNGDAENLQFAIYNNINNDIESARFSMGMLGFSQFSPINLSTTEGMSMEFHISKNSKELTDLYSNGLGLPDYSYNNYPQLSIDTNNCVNINKEKCYDPINVNGIIKIPQFYVNGYALISNIYTYDYFVKSNLHLDDIYIRKNGLTLKANQIIGGDFINQEFTFNSNLYIGKTNNNFNLNVNGSIITSRNITSESLNANETIINGVAEFNKTTYFNHIAIFNDDLSINKSINITNDLFLQGIRVSPSNLYQNNNSLNFDNDCNLSISGRFGTGILNTDSYDEQFNIIKRRKERFEIYLQDSSGISADNSKVFIGHSILEDLFGNKDNSLIFLTQKNIKWHNIYFFAGKDKNGFNGFKNQNPNLAIMENNMIGINTKTPIKTLDIIGECLANDYFIRNNNQILKLNHIYLNNQNSSILNVYPSLDINLPTNETYYNKKTLNIKGGINSYDGYFENDRKITTFKTFDKISSTFANIGIGIIETNNNYQIPLQIRNTTSNINNNTILRLYRGVKGGGFNNNAYYTGIDFCDYDMPIRSQNRNNYKWFIYKNHQNNNNNVGTLQIGYTDNSYNPTHSCMNFYYNQTNKKYFIDINNPNVNYNYNPNNAVSIKGDVEIDGNLNLKNPNNSFMINGIIVGSFSNPVIIDKINNSILNTNTTNYTDNINDLTLIGNKISIFPSKTSFLGFKDNWVFNKINNIQASLIQNNPLFIYNNKDYYDDTIPPVITKFYNKSYKNFSARPDVAIIELGILSDTNDEGVIENKVDFKVKGYSDNYNNNKLSIFELVPNNQKPFLTCINYQNKNQINFGIADFYSSNHIIYNDTAFHIFDDFNCLLRLTNQERPVSIIMSHDNNDWTLKSDSNLKITYNNQASILNLNKDGTIIANDYSFSSNNYSSFNLNSIVNKSGVKCTNYYYNNYNNDFDDSFETTDYINMTFSNLIINSNVSHYDNYDDNLDNNLSYFIYKFHDSNLPTTNLNDNVIFNYSINNSNFIYNNNLILNFNTTIFNVGLDYRNFDDIRSYNSSNTIDLIPTLKSYNPNLSASFKTFDIIPTIINLNGIQLPLNYRVPKTIDDELSIETIISTSNLNSNYLNNIYSNLNLITFLNVKNNENNDYKIKTIIDDYQISHSGFNYIYKTINSIYYYPAPNINVLDVNLNIKYNYNYQNHIIIPKNFFGNYTNIINIDYNQGTSIIINNSNYFLSNLIYADNPETYVDANNFRKLDYTISNHINKLYDIEINNINVATINLSILKNDYFEKYIFTDENINLFIPVYENKFQPHLVLNNYINSSYTSSHKIYSYKNNYEIYNDDKRLISIDSNGSLNTNGDIDTSNIYFKGDIYLRDGNNTTSIMNNLSYLVGNNFNIEKNNISLNTNNNIFLNPSVINKGGVIINGSDILSENNLFQINNYNGNNNFITLKSVDNSGFIHFWGTNSLFRLGFNNGNFGIWSYNKNLTYPDNFINNNFDNFHKLLNFNYDFNNNISIDLGANIKTTNNFAINDITTYTDNSVNYKLRIHGNMKVDGIVISSSDIRIKNNINKIDNALDKLEKISGITYNLKNDNQNNRYTGLIAQEVQEVIPEAVYKGDDGLLNIAYGNLMGLVIEAIKELRKEIKAII